MLSPPWVVEAPEIYIYIRDEYPEVRLMLADEIAKVVAPGSPSMLGFISVAAPALISAAKNPR
jgi:hypothetical protein